MPCHYFCIFFFNLRLPIAVPPVLLLHLQLYWENIFKTFQLILRFLKIKRTLNVLIYIHVINLYSMLLNFYILTFIWNILRIVWSFFIFYLIFLIQYIGNLVGRISLIWSTLLTISVLNWTCFLKENYFNQKSQWEFHHSMNQKEIILIDHVMMSSNCLIHPLYW